ncbi:TPA: hypothetical protein ACNVNE_001542 [Klebsiella aerogenes]
MIRKVLNIATVTAILAASAGTAFADVDESTVNIQSVMLNFGGESISEHTLTPVSNLPLELSSLQTVANGSVHINGDQEIDYVAIRWTPGYEGQLVSSSSKSDATISGQNDESNKLNLAIAFANGGASSVSGDGNWIYAGGFNTGDQNYVVVSKSAVTVVPDKYNISVDAAIYTK